MSIQRRPAISIVLAIALSLSVGSLLTYVHILTKGRSQTNAALAAGAQKTAKALDEAKSDADPGSRLRRLVRDFDSDDGVRLVLRDPTGRIIGMSMMLPPLDAAPDWFNRMTAATPLRRDVPLPATFRSTGSLVLEADPRQSTAYAWSAVRLSLPIMIVCSLVALALGLATMRRAGASVHQPDGDGVRDMERAPLAVGVDDMAAQLDALNRQNIALREQIMHVRQEERAELARDLHDEVAPFLFGIEADAAVISRYLATGATSDAMPRAEAITISAKDMQRRLKGVLSRLTPGILVEIGFAGAVDDLIDHWAKRRPDCSFRVSITGAPLDPPLDALAFRIVQESVSNAIRHGAPSQVDITIDVGPDRARIVVDDDGTGFSDERPPLGFGLAGMQARARLVGGSISVRNRTGGRGVTLEALLPLDVEGRADATSNPDAPA